MGASRDAAPREPRGQSRVWGSTSPAGGTPPSQGPASVLGGSRSRASHREAP